MTSWRRHDHTLVLGIATALLAIAVGAVTARHSTSDFGVIAGYVRWLWSIAAFSWFLIAVAATRSVLAWRARARPDAAAPAGAPVVRARPAWLPVAGVGVVALLVVLTLPTVDNGSSTEAWTVAPTKLLTREVLDGLRPADGVPLVRRQWSGFALSFDASLALELARRDIPFRVYGDERIEQYGSQYAYAGHDADYALILTQNPSLGAPYERLGFESAASPAQAAELRDLDAKVATWIKALPLRPAASMDAAKVPPQFQAIVADTVRRLNAERADPDYIVTSGDLLQLARVGYRDTSGRLVSYFDTTGIGDATLRRWATLHWDLWPRQLAVYRAPLDATPPLDPFSQGRLAAPR